MIQMSWSSGKSTSLIALSNPDVRIDRIVEGGLIVLIVLVAFIQPQMLVMGMTRVQHLVVGFGL